MNLRDPCSFSPSLGGNKDDKKRIAGEEEAGLLGLREEEGTSIFEEILCPAVVLSVDSKQRLSGVFHFAATQVGQRERTEPRRNSARRLLGRQNWARTELQGKASSGSSDLSLIVGRENSCWLSSEDRWFASECEESSTSFEQGVTENKQVGHGGPGRPEERHPSACCGSPHPYPCPGMKALVRHQLHFTVFNEIYEQYSMVEMYQIFTIHSSDDGYIGCFQVLAIMNIAVMDMDEQVSL
ncbi:uncharacterized protein LOC116101374 [Mastomys coucha]|uniref:uncharacterized protein LOC116101374 n=1 Tax=Mastomys coucha TaxID=35658 RepID=UPI00126214A8|nr:uncharacterized protein LOC116101374 [Mastomys coucha]